MLVVIVMDNQLLRLKVKERELSICLDILPTNAHINPLWVMAYDDYPIQSIREKERLIPYYIYQDYWFLYYHDNVFFSTQYERDGKTIKQSIKR